MTDRPLSHSPKFLTALGTFYSAWQTTEMVVDYQIAEFLDIPDEETHLLTAGMEFGRKLRFLIGLIKRSSHLRKSELIGILNKIQNDSKRNAFAHSYIIESDDGKIRFLERNTGGSYKPTLHPFSLDEFDAHVLAFLNRVKELVAILQISESVLVAFALAALSAAHNPTTSPQPPSDKA